MPGLLPDVGRRHAEAAAKRTGEIGQIPESDFRGDITDGEFGKLRVIQKPMGLDQPALENISGEGKIFSLEQFLDVARRHPMALSQLRKGEIASAEMLCDVDLDGGKPRRAQAAASGDFGGVGGRVDSERQ